MLCFLPGFPNVQPSRDSRFATESAVALCIVLLEINFLFADQFQEEEEVVPQLSNIKIASKNTSSLSMHTMFFQCSVYFHTGGRTLTAAVELCGSR